MLHVLKSYYPQWEERDICYKKLPHALSNEVYQVTHKATGESVLVRVYLDQQRSNSLDLDLSIQAGLLGLGPKILSTCPEGSCEEFIHGRTMSHAEVRSEEYIKKLARAIRKLHDAKITHNDMHHNNIIIDDMNGVRLVDFEYAKKDSSPDEVAFDLANHFCGWMYNFSADDWHIPKPLPDDDFKKMATLFLETYYDPDPLPEDCFERIVSRIYDVHLYWITWALGYYSHTHDDKYMQYAVARARLNPKIVTAFAKDALLFSKY